MRDPRGDGKPDRTCLKLLIWRPGIQEKSNEKSGNTGHFYSAFYFHKMLLKRIDVIRIMLPKRQHQMRVILGDRIHRVRRSRANTGGD